MRAETALHAVAIVAILCVGQSQQQLGAPQLEVSVYGSASFKDQFCVGSHEHPPTPGAQSVVMAGGKSEISFHDRERTSYSDSTRWALYSTKGALRSHRSGNEGGIMLESKTTKILKDLNVGGSVKANSLNLKGKGELLPEATTGHPVLIGSLVDKHLKMGYHKGYSWIQSGDGKNPGHLALNPLKNAVCVGVSKPGGDGKKLFTVGGGHLRVTKKAFVGDMKAFVSQTHLQFAFGSGWHMSGTDYLRTINDVPIHTKGGGMFMGNVGIGALPKFPIFRLQVHGGSVMVTDKANKGLTISQTKEGALIRSWNVDTKNHEGLLIEGAPLLIQPVNGIVLFGTTVRKKDMHVHMGGNLYIHGHMFAMKNLHVKDQATVKHLIMPSLNLKNKPQSPDGDTLVIGHIKKEGNSPAAAPWAAKDAKKPVIVGINLRLGFHADYTWIQVHGKDQGERKPLALNPLGNTVAIGTTTPDKRVKLHVKGNGYVLGTLFVKQQGAKQEEYLAMENQEALEAMQQTRFREQMDETSTLTEFRDSTLSFLEVPKSLRGPNEDNSASVHRISEMYASVLKQQHVQMQNQIDVLEQQAKKISQLRAFLEAQ